MVRSTQGRSRSPVASLLWYRGETAALTRDEIRTLEEKSKVGSQKTEV